MYDTLGRRDFFHPTIVLISDRKEDILRAWLENGQTERVILSTGEPPEEIGRDFLSAVISEVGASAAEKFRSVGADVLAKCFHDLKRSAAKVLEGRAEISILHRAFDDGLVSLLAAHALSTQNITKEYRKAVDEAATVTITDTRGVIINANDRFCEISGYSREELIGMPHSIVRHPDMPKETFENLWTTIKSKKVWHGVLKNRKKNGEHFWVNTTISPIL